MSKSYNIPVIYFHSIAPKQNKNWSRSWLTLELKYFENILKYLKTRKYESLFLNEYLEIRKHKNGKYFCLTFDDGYLDNYVYVFPLLERYEYKATIFVNPEFVDQKASIRYTLKDYWDNKVSLKEIDKWGFLSWKEMLIREK